MQIEVRQISGLGNQLFQYAAGRYFSRRYGAPLILAIDQSGAISYGFPRPFLLSKFLIRAEIRRYTPIDRYRVQPPRYLAGLFARLNHLQGIQVYRELFDRRYDFVPEIAIDRNVRSLHLVGYWQSYRFAASVAKELRSELAFSEPPEGKNLEILHEIHETPDSVSLHLRRGDYIGAAEGDIALSLDYYARAVELFRQTLTSPTYFVFSDDMEFARKNLVLHGKVRFIDHNDSFSAHEDLRLMSACQNHIIANSTFSWWGAWLNPSNSKIVYAPKYWLLSQDSYFPDLFPPDWILDDNLPGREIQDRDGNR